MKLEALDNCSKDSMKMKTGTFLICWRVTGTTGTTGLWQMALDVYEFIQSCPWPENGLTK